MQDRSDFETFCLVLGLMGLGLLLGAGLSVAGQFAAWWWRWS
jgi:hypothetical protein